LTNPGKAEGLTEKVKGAWKELLGKISGLNVPSSLTDEERS